MVKDVVTLSSAAAAATAKAGLDLKEPARSFGIEIGWAVTGALADKAITALVVAIEGSLTGTTYQALDTAITLSAPEITALYALRFIVDKPTQFIRANVTTCTITGNTGTVTLTIKALPMR